MPPYNKKANRQQYLVKRKVKQKVQTKLKKHAASQPKTAPPVLKSNFAEAPEAEQAQKLPPGYRTTMHYKGENVAVTAAVRYETEKTDPLVKIKHVAPNGEIVHREFVGPAKREAWFDDHGKEYDKADIKTAQVMPDGSLKPVVITKTKDINVEPVEPEIAQEFLPYSYLEVWGEGESDEDGLRKIARDLVTSGKIGAIKEFSHGYDKVYVGFMKPVISRDGESFGVEIMLSENRRRRRRWMLADKTDVAPKTGKAEIPQLW